jgi:hypothetical protein
MVIACLAVKQSLPAIKQTMLAVEQSTPAIKQTSLAVEQSKLAVKQTKLTVKQTTPAVKQSRLAVGQTTPAAKQTISSRIGRVTVDNCRGSLSIINRQSENHQCPPPCSWDWYIGTMTCSR